MRVVIMCEKSEIIRNEFEAKGHDAWSCDLEPSDGNGKKHIRDDARKHLNDGWDLMIAHPPCTRLAVCCNKWYKPEYADRFPNIHREREQAIEFFMEFANADIPRKCIENPVGIMSTLWRKPDQIIQPYQFGHPEPKKTCLWLYWLQPLIPTKIVEPEYFTTKSGKRMGTWFYKPSFTKDRQIMRSRTFPGIAKAMAEQWG